jgi:hypothetical protein
MRSEIESIKEMSDRTLHACPLGVRFRDDVLQAVISDGLKVTAYPVANPQLRVEAISNPSGVFVFHGLPGLHDFEFREGQKPWNDLDPWTTAVSSRPYCIEVRDNLRRFLPFLMMVQTPKKGMVAWNRNGPVSSPDTAISFVPLFSSPARSAPPGMAVLRAELWDPEENRPARALLEASFKGQLMAQGLADERGLVVLIFPYPEPARLQISPHPGSPPGNPGLIPLRDQEWRIDLRAFYKPDANGGELPDLEMVCNQPAASMWQDEQLQNELDHASQQFGKETILRTETAGETLPVLYVTSAVSPP